MKKYTIFLLIFLIFFVQNISFAVGQANPVPPKWEDYVPEKYQNPRDGFSRGNSIAELIVGIILTDLIFTSPIGIPMIYHATTKLKNISYCEKKERFDDALEYAKEIKSKEKLEKYYQKMPKKCGLKESQKKKNIKRRQKAAEKAAKKQAELEQMQGLEQQSNTIEKKSFKEKFKFKKEKPVVN